MVISASSPRGAAWIFRADVAREDKSNFGLVRMPRATRRSSESDWNCSGCRLDEIRRDLRTGEFCEKSPEKERRSPSTDKFD